MKKRLIVDVSKQADRYIHTSADDLRVSLPYCTNEDLAALREALEWCHGRQGYKTKELHLRRRIRELERGMP